MIKVLHYIGSLDCGGSQSFVMNIYRNIDRSKVQFDFVTFPDEKGPLYDEIINLGGKIYEAPHYNGKNHFLFVKWWKNFFENHSEYKILHGHVRSVASIYLPIAKRYGVITIAHSHSTSNGKGITSLIKNIMQFPVRFQADYLFGCSKPAGEWMFGEKAVKSKKYYTVANAIHVDNYTFDESVRKRYREELGLNDKVVYIHVGRLHPSKNHDFMLELFAKIRETTGNAYLLLVGDGELREYVENKILSLNLTDSVRVLGTRLDINNLLMCADVFLFPSQWEGLGMAVVEAQASGLPCLVSDQVPKEVGLTDLVHFLPINDGYELWLEKLTEIDISRKDVKNEIKQAGYDIVSIANWLQDFYLKI